MSKPDSDTPKCPTCKGGREADVPCSNAFHIESGIDAKPPEWAHEDFIRDVPDSDTRLEELLKDFAESLERTGGANPTWLARGPEGVSEARAAIESFFAQQEARIRELEAEREKRHWEKIEAGNRHDAQLASLRTELERLKEDSLTAEEILMLRSDLVTAVDHMIRENPVVKEWPMLRELWERVMADLHALNKRLRLRRLSNPDAPK